MFQTPAGNHLFGLIFIKNHDWTWERQQQNRQASTQGKSPGKCVIMERLGVIGCCSTWNRVFQVEKHNLHYLEFFIAIWSTKTKKY